MDQNPGDGPRWHDEPPLFQDAGTAGEGSSPRSPSDPEPQASEGGLLHRLDSVERVVGRVYEFVLYLLVAGMTGLAAFLYVVLPDDGNRDFLLLYGGVVYGLGMLWATSQIFAVRRRRNRQPDPDNLISALRSKINVTIESSPQVSFIDDAALDRAQRQLDAGGTLDEACAAIDPRYRAMNRLMKGLFQKAVEAALQQRRKPGS
jgi:hypothetical protein